MAIVHVFFGSETTVPRYRKRLYGVTDLIGDDNSYFTPASISKSSVINVFR